MDLNKLYKSANNVFEMMSDIIGTNSFFIALNDGKRNRVIRAFNKGEVLVEDGADLNFQDTY